MASLVRCAHCGASLLAADYLGQPAAAMDRALAHHFSGHSGADEEVTCASMGGVTDAGVAGRSTGDRGGSLG